MIDGSEVKEYRREKSVKLFESYKDLIDKTFEVIDKDLLQEKIDGNDGTDAKESEQKYLDAIAKRRKALDEVDVMLDKVEKLEKVLKDPDSEDSETETAGTMNIAKRKALEKKQNHESA